MLIPGMLMRRAVKGDIGLIAAAKALQDEILAPSLDAPGDDPLEAEQFVVRGFKKVGLMLLGTAMQTYGDKVSDEQEILSWTSDMLMDTFAAESAVRARAAEPRGQAPGRRALQVDVARLFVSDAALRIEAAARQALAGMADGDTLRVLLAALRRLLKVAPVNTVTIRRRLARCGRGEGRVSANLRCSPDRPRAIRPSRNLAGARGTRGGSLGPGRRACGSFALRRESPGDCSRTPERRICWPTARAEGRAVRGGLGQSDPGGQARPVPAARLLRPGRSGIACRRCWRRSRAEDGDRDADLHRQAARNAARRSARDSR